MRANSLAFRLIVAAALWSVLAMAAAGIILSTLYRQNAEQAFDDRLHVYLNTLIGTLAAQDPAQPLSDPGNVGEQRFELLYSGWYWQVREPDNGAVLLTSRSLFSDVLDVTKAARVKEEAGIESGSFAGPDKQKLRFLSQTVTFDKARRFDVLVAGDAGNLEQQISSFRTTVIFLLAAFALGLIIATAAQIRWTFRPLDRIRRSLADLRSGKQTRFEEGLPAEIKPLVDELNALLESNREIVERARTQVGNLAHALKTPLSVITNEARAGAGPFAAKVAEQAETMRKQISHYLDRARIAGQVNVIGALTDVHPAVTRLVRAMNRIHGERGIRIDSRGPEDARFRGEQQDLEEIVGNLVDNACKWARTQVSVTVRYAAPSAGDAAGSLTLLIEDDGPGLTADQIADATARGRRLDETKPGSGLGLSIVTDLVALYRGSFSLDASPLGGLRATVNLPAA
jgi:signal transduction histidine kinase